jgi:6-phosphofructokinase 1
MMVEVERTLGILTGGGDCPGLNAVVRAAAHRCMQRGARLVGYRNGWEGVLDRSSLLLDRQAVKGILPLGGTVLGTSRTDPLVAPNGVERLRQSLEADGVEGLLVVGGDGTLSAAAELLKEGFKLVGVPKTIDNDLSATDTTFGFDTAVGIATEAIDRLHTTAEAHNRVIVVEVMGHHTGWIAAYAGIAGGADVILAPEYSFNVDSV